MIPVYRYEDLDDDGSLTHGATRLHLIADGSEPDEQPCRVELQQIGRDTERPALSHVLAAESIVEAEWSDE